MSDKLSDEQIVKIAEQFGTWNNHGYMRMNGEQLVMFAIAILRRALLSDGTASPAPAIPACQCDMHTKVLGDGCEACQPENAPAISESEDAVKLDRSIEAWRKCDPDLMSRQSPAAIFCALRDAKHDILALDAARKGGKS